MLRFIKTVLKKIIPPLIIEVPINTCVHYCGFRYGLNNYNPYQTYIVERHQGVALEKCRETFISFLKYYRPENMGQALGINLTAYVPLWIYPWNRCAKKTFLKKTAWLKDPKDCPDIMTHFSSQGILKSRIEEEFTWLERAYRSIKEEGYKPKKYRNYIELLRFVRLDKGVSYLVLDGNHRLGALYSLGENKVMAIVRQTIYEKDCNKWYGVRKNFISKADALNIFNAYFSNNKNYKTTEVAAEII